MTGKPLGGPQQAGPQFGGPQSGGPQFGGPQPGGFPPAGGAAAAPAAKGSGLIPILVALAALSAVVVVATTALDVMGIGKASRKAMPYLFYIKDEDVVMGTKTSGIKPRTFLDGLEKGMDEVDLDAISPNGKYLYFTECSNEDYEDTLYLLDLNSKKAEPLEIDEDVYNVVALDNGALYLSDETLYKTDTKGNTEKLLKDVQGFMLSKDRKKLLYSDGEDFFLTDVALKKDEEKLSLSYDDSMKFYEEDLTGFIYSNDSRLFISRNNNEIKVTSKLKSTWCCGDPSGKNMQIVYTEGAGKDEDRTSVYLYQEKGDKIIPVIEDEDISLITADGGSTSYVFAIWDKKHKGCEYYFGIGSNYGLIPDLDEDTAIESLTKDEKTGKYYAFTYDKEKGAEKTGMIIELSLKKDTANYTELYEAISFRNAADGKVFYYTDQNKDGSRLMAVNGSDLSDDVEKSTYLGDGKMAIIIDWSDKSSSGTLQVYDGKKVVDVDDDVSQILSYTYQ